MAAIGPTMSKSRSPSIQQNPGKKPDYPALTVNIYGYAGSISTDRVPNDANRVGAKLSLRLYWIWYVNYILHYGMVVVNLSTSGSGSFGVGHQHLYRGYLQWLRRRTPSFPPCAWSSASSLTLGRVIVFQQISVPWKLKLTGQLVSPRWSHNM